MSCFSVSTAAAARWDHLVAFQNTRSCSHTEIGILHIPACDVSNHSPFRLRQKCHKQYITSSQAFISFMNPRWLSHVSIYTINFRRFSKLLWLCTFPSIYVGTVRNLQLATQSPLCKKSMTIRVIIVATWFIFSSSAEWIYLFQFLLSV